MPLRCRPGAESAPQRAAVKPTIGRGDPGQPALHGSSGVEPTPQPARRGAVDGHGRVGGLPGLVPSRAGQRGRLHRGAAASCGPAVRGRSDARLRARRAGAVPVCGRRMDSHWVNGRAGYRCRHGHHSARARPADAARNIYVREDVLLVWLATHFASDRRRSGGAVEPSTAEEVVARLRLCRCTSSTRRHVAGNPLPRAAAGKVWERATGPADRGAPSARRGTGPGRRYLRARRSPNVTAAADRSVCSGPGPPHRASTEACRIRPVAPIAPGAVTEVWYPSLDQLAGRQTPHALQLAVDHAMRERCGPLRLFAAAVPTVTTKAISSRPGTPPGPTSGCARGRSPGARSDGPTRGSPGSPRGWNERASRSRPSAAGSGLAPPERPPALRAASINGVRASRSLAAFSSERSISPWWLLSTVGCAGRVVGCGGRPGCGARDPGVGAAVSAFGQRGARSGHVEVSQRTASSAISGGTVCPPSNSCTSVVMSAAFNRGTIRRVVWSIGNTVLVRPWDR